MEPYQEQSSVATTVRIVERADWSDSDASGSSTTSSKQRSSPTLAAWRESQMLAFIMEVMCSTVSMVFPVFGTRSVFTLWDNSSGQFNSVHGLSYLWFGLTVVAH
jgi:hypothetical protein